LLKLLTLLIMFVAPLGPLSAQSLGLDRIVHLEDAAGTLTAEQALPRLRAQTVPFQTIAEPYSDHYHWFLLDIHARADREPSDLLHIRNPLISELDAWLVHGDTLIPLPHQDLRHRYPLISVPPPTTERFQILLRIFFPDMTLVTMDLQPPALAAESSLFNSFSFAFMLAGFATGLMLYNLILFLFLRDLDLGNFSLYALTVILATFGATGGFTALGLPSWVNRWVPCLAVIAMASAMNFTRSFFDTRRSAPIFDKLFWAGQISNLGCGLLLAFNISRKFQYLIDLNMVLGLILCLVFAVTAWSRGHDLARNYLFGLSGYVGAVFIFISMQYGWIPRNMLTENVQLFALDIHILVLSSAIGSKITRMRSELLARLQEANTALERKVEERTRTVMEQQQTMIQTAKMASLGEMAGGIAHEINNPLMIINGYAENMSSLIQKGDLTQERARIFHERIEKATDRIRKIVNGLQNLSRDAADDEYDDTTLSELIRDALSLCESRFSHKGVRLKVALPEREVALRCNTGQIGQVLINLLNNAFDAIESMDGAWVEIRGEDLGSGVAIRVSDCGTGIPPEVVHRIFDPFFTTKEIGKGTGLGLSISKNLVERQGGRIFVDQNSPHTCFVLELRKHPGLEEKAA
jgi:signal transduction histidine kinase